MDTKVYWKEAIAMIKEGKTLIQEKIDFKNELIPLKEVTFLNKNSIRVPESLIYYDDDDIDCSDIPEITPDDITTGKIQWISNEFAIDNELRNWIITQNIKLNELIPHLLKSFYQSVKFTQKNVAV